jgi:HK97 family phage major capsid protein
VFANSGFTSFGEYLVHVRRAGLSIGKPDARLLHRRGVPLGASEQVPSDGGFLVPPEFAQKLWEKMYLQGSLLSRALEVPLTKNALVIPGIDEQSRVDGSRWGGVQSHWVNEADPLTATKPKFRQRELTARKLICLIDISDELYSDVDAMDIFGQQIAAKELVYRIEDSMVNGPGTFGPQGILNSGALITIAKDAGQAPATVTANNIVGMFGRMWAPSRVGGGGAVWVVNQELEPLLMTLTQPVGTAGSAIPIYKPTENPDVMPFATMLGSPVVPVEYCAPIGTPGDILYCSWSDYVLAAKSAQEAVSMHVLFTTDQMVYRVTLRADGQSLWHTPLLPANGSGITKSPFIALAQR